MPRILYWSISIKLLYTDWKGVMVTDISDLCSIQYLHPKPQTPNPKP